MDYSFIIQQIVFGLTLGCLYALLAIGYSMVYGVLRLINFAHGDLFMVSAYIAFFGIVMFQLPMAISFIIAIVLTGGLGIVIDRGAYKPLRKSPRISALITAIGVSFLLENLGIVSDRRTSQDLFHTVLFSNSASTIGESANPVLIDLCFCRHRSLSHGINMGGSPLPRGNGNEGNLQRR